MFEYSIIDIARGVVAKFEENRRAMGMLNPLRENNEGLCRGEGRAPTTCYHGLSSRLPSFEQNACEDKQRNKRRGLKKPFFFVYKLLYNRIDYLVEFYYCLNWLEKKKVRL